jgi:serine/threonine-protein kinase
LDEAIAEYHTAIRLKPDDPGAHNNLGNALRDQGKLDEAIAEFHTAIRLKPVYAEAHCNLGLVLGQQGRFTEALTELERGHALGSKRANWRYPSGEWVRQARRLVELESRLPEILHGKGRPANTDETLALADLCSGKHLHAVSARFWQEAFQAQPALAEDKKARNRYNAACAAALAGAGQGKDEPKLDEVTKARWRKQALEWLRADLASWTKSVETASPQAKALVIQALQHWKTNPDLSGLRDEPALAKLPADEQKACRAFWSEVDALLKKAKPTSFSSGK